MSLIELQAWLPGSDLSGAPDHTFASDDQLVDAGFNPVLWGEGDGFLEIHADDPDAQYLQRRGFIRAVRTDTDEGLFWWILEEGSVKLLSNPGKVQKVIRWEGRGMLYYLDRYKLGQAVWAPGQPNRGSVTVIDYWTWIDQPMIAILTRFMEEGQYDTRADFLDKLTYDFNRTQDSNGNSLTDVSLYQVRNGTGGLTLAADAMRQGNLLQVLPESPPLLQAFRALSEYRTDRTSGTYASGKVRFAAGQNIATELPHKIVALRERTHTLTRRQDGQYATEALNGSGEPYMEFMEVPHTSDPDAVEAFVGESHLSRQKQSTVAVIRHKIGPGGISGAQGYFPSPAGHYWLGDLVTAHSGTGEYDLNEQTLEVAGIRYFLRGADWMVEAQLGAQIINSAGAPINIPNAGPTVPAGPRIELCQAGAAGVGDIPEVESGGALAEDTADVVVGFPAVTGEANSCLVVLFCTDPGESGGETVDFAAWRPDGGTTPSQAFTRIAGPTDGMEVWILQDPDAATDPSAYVRVHPSGSRTYFAAAAYVTGLDASSEVRDTEFASGTGTVASVAIGTESGDRVLNIGAQFENNIASLAVPTAGGDQTELATDTRDTAFGQRDSSGGFGHQIASGATTTPTWTFNASRLWRAVAIAFTGQAITYSGDGPLELIGTSIRAARCDHNHLVETLLTEETDDSLRLAPDGAGGLEWAAGGSVSEITDIPTAETDTALVLKPDGAGGVEWGADATGGGGSGPVPWALVPETGISNTGNSTIGTNNNGYVVPATLIADATITGMLIRVTNATGNISVALYDEAFNRVATSGSVACPAVGHAEVDFTSPYAATAGRYWLFISGSVSAAAFAHSGSTGTSASPIHGYVMTTAHPAPATFTPGGAARSYAIAGAISGGWAA